MFVSFVCFLLLFFVVVFSGGGVEPRGSVYAITTSSLGKIKYIPRILQMIRALLFFNNFNPNIDKQLHPLRRVGLNDLFIP